MSRSEILIRLEAAVSAIRKRQSEREEILYLLEDEMSNSKNGEVDLVKVQRLMQGFSKLNTEDFQASTELSTLLLISSGIRK